ncbi:MAG TPA: vWA domain-containing protein [Thermoanaerobaculia bacterium]
MTFLDPLWLVLAIPLAALLWYRRPPSHALLLFRAVVTLLIVLALAGLALKLPSRAGVVAIVADRSLSLPGNSDALQRELVATIESARASDSRVAIVSFGRHARVEQPPTSMKFADFQLGAGQDGSNLHDGITTALSLIPRGTPGRIVVISDGRWTGSDPRAAALQASARGIGVDYRVVERSTAADVAIERIDAPGTVAPGESFLVGAWVHAPTAQNATVELRRGSTLIASGTRALESGANRIVFRDRAPRTGTLGYSLHVATPANDPVPENNRARFLVGVDGPKAVLVVSGAKGSRFPQFLAAGGLDIDAPAKPEFSLESLSNYSAVVLENVPAADLGPNAMSNIAQWVSGAGGGLMVTGGTSSYSSGGFYKSALDPVLPVSMELRREHRKLNMAIVIAMDRSGSMGMEAGGGRTKMELANLSAAEVLGMLSPRDELGVVAVDSMSHIIADLEPIEGRNDLRKRILSVDVGGGGIFIFEALSTAARMLLTANAETRHIILLADAADSEEPGAYKELLEKCKAANITVTVVGLGKPDDVDAGLLNDIAVRGGGRIYFTEDANQLPRLFAQDTFIVARSTFIDEPVSLQPTGGLFSLTGRSFAAMPPAGGFNLTYLREGATAAVLTHDDYRAPLVASWQSGAGRVLAYTGEVDGKFTGAMARWSDIGNFYSSLARWTAGGNAPLPGDVFVSQRVENGVAHIELQLDPERTSTALRDLPRVTTLAGAAGAPPSTQRASMSWTSPDDLAIDIPLSAGSTYLSTVDAPGLGRVTLPPVVLPFSPELAQATAGEGRTALERIARATGGRERLRVGEIWKDVPRQSRHVPLRLPLLIAAIVMLLLEVAERRIRWLGLVPIPKLPAMPAMKMRAPKERVPRVEPVAKSAKPEKVVEPEEVAEPPADALIDALRKAGRRAQRKM